MNMRKKYQSEILMVLHQDADALHRIGAISDDEMRQWDIDCLTPEVTRPTATLRLTGNSPPSKIWCQTPFLQ
jgi:DNA-binding transcriptional regulator YiaG